MLQHEGITPNANSNSHIILDDNKLHELGFTRLTAEFKENDNPNGYPEIDELYQHALDAYNLVKAGILPDIPDYLDSANGGLLVEEFEALGFEFCLPKWNTPILSDIHKRLDYYLFDCWFSKVKLPDGWVVVLDEDYSPWLLNTFYILDANGNKRVRIYLYLEIGIAEMTLLHRYNVKEEHELSSENDFNCDIHISIVDSQGNVVEKIGTEYAVLIQDALDKNCKSKRINKLREKAQQVWKEKYSHFKFED